VFQTDQRSRLNYIGRLRAYRDITESTNIDVGTSIAQGPTDLGIKFPDFTTDPERLDRRLVGVDATFRYRPLRRAIYKRFQARTELIWSRQDIAERRSGRRLRVLPVGEYQFAQRWYVGRRSISRSAATTRRSATRADRLS
jgi:hypothetical protein